MHAAGQLEDVVKRAIELGFQVYGLTEHMPRTRLQDLYPEESHLTPSDLAILFSDFYIHAQALQAKYKDQITLLIGMETELIHEATLGEIKSICQKTLFDYLVGSVHHVRGFPIDFDEPGFTKLEKHLVDQIAFGSNQTVASDLLKDASIGTEMAFQEYFDAQYSLIDQIRPAVVAHFDLVRLFRPTFPLSQQVWTKIDRNIQLISQYGGLVEINSRAWKKQLRDAYPQRDILKKMIDAGLRFCVSDDSHGPKDVGMHYDRLAVYLAEMGIHEISYPTPLANKKDQTDVGKNDQVQVVTLTNVLESLVWERCGAVAMQNPHGFNKDDEKGCNKHS
ncbi:hypothetical protein O5D80_006929 [Batrachochytrium dendrobatidis]|nr:hypothetical protein O5D80_006929 [Batrachochytrium dendrobatidis]